MHIPHLNKLASADILSCSLINFSIIFFRHDVDGMLLILLQDNKIISALTNFIKPMS